MESTRIYRIKDVCILTGLKPSTIYKLIREKSFPKAIHLTARCTGWPSDVVNSWVTSRIEEASK
jgi:prophage regulatory protein